jgi:hypothetical protein
MWPRFSLWSDYGTSGRNYRMSVAGPSIGRKIFLTAVIVAAAAIGIRELYGQVADKRGALEPTAHPQSLSTPSANPTGRRTTSIATIPLSPQPALSLDQVASVSPALAPAPEPSSQADPVVPSTVSGDHPVPALTAIPGALAKAGALPRPPAALAAKKLTDSPRSAGPHGGVHVAHHIRTEGRSFAGYAEVIARLGRSKEFRAAWQSFL